MRRGRSGPAVYGQLGALLVLACLGFWKDVYGKVVGAGEVGKQPGVGQGHLDRALVQANIQPQMYSTTPLSSSGWVLRAGYMWGSRWSLKHLTRTSVDRCM